MNSLQLLLSIGFILRILKAVFKIGFNLLGFVFFTTLAIALFLVRWFFVLLGALVNVGRWYC